MSRRFEALICGRGFLRQGLWGRKVLSDRCLPALRAAAEGAHRRSSGLNRHPLDAGLPVGPLAPDVGCRPARPAKGPPAPGVSRRFEALICGRGFLRQGLWGRKVLSDRCLPALRAAAEGAHRRSSGLNRHPLDAGLPVGPLAPDVGCRPARPAKGPPAPGLFGQRCPKHYSCLLTNLRKLELV